MDAAVSGNWSAISIRAARNSKRKSISVYQMMHWSTTIWTMSEPEYGPYMAISSGIPMTSVLGSVEREKSVMDQSSRGAPVREGRRDHAASPARTSSFCSVSAARKRRFMAYGSLVEMKWKDRSGTAKMATKRLMPEHWSGVKMPHHRTDPYARNIATYSGTTAAITV
ncbi:Os01g0643450 [Oryza sativa Japonica Group]|uniref:Os01g0643450 protein n=1 Tax=Oryza sativa subsp. japonica TaxID=39947 RepID=A0A0P0V5T4_ORYSJ|nr:hypothetical protein EE612_004619 [Oryza sativa]BAS73382.1 Os01g0643450 [Oryza sativa Japonica Group]